MPVDSKVITAYDDRVNSYTKQFCGLLPRKVIMKKENTPEPIQALRHYNCIRRQTVEVIFSDFPLQDPAQYNLLMGIERLSHGSMLPSQQDLSEFAHRSPSTVTASLKVLERQGLVRRTPDKEDQRVNRVALTKTGSELAIRCRDKMELLERRIICGFSTEEICQLTHLLDKMSDNLSAVLTDKKEAGTID